MAGCWTVMFTPGSSSLIAELIASTVNAPVTSLLFASSPVTMTIVVVERLVRATD